MCLERFFLTPCTYVISCSVYLQIELICKRCDLPRYVKFSSPALFGSQRFSFKIISLAEITHEMCRNCEGRRVWSTKGEYRDRHKVTGLYCNLRVFIASDKCYHSSSLLCFLLVNSGRRTRTGYDKRIAQNIALLRCHFITAYYITSLFRKSGVCRRLSQFFSPKKRFLLLCIS